jgi:CRP-like cAMP-binding protein
LVALAEKFDLPYFRGLGRYFMGWAKAEGLALMEEAFAPNVNEVLYKFLAAALAEARFDAGRVTDARNGIAAQAFSATLARQVMNLRTRIEQRNIRSASERIRHFLALNAGADGRTIKLRGTLKELAAELGLTHEALYRTLAALEHSGEIKRRGSRITLAKHV